MEQKIGEIAGKLWKELNKRSELAISQVPKIIKEKDTSSYMALGWLAREGKLKFKIVKNKTMVSLLDKQ